MDDELEQTVRALADKADAILRQMRSLEEQTIRAVISSGSDPELARTLGRFEGSLVCARWSMHSALGAVAHGLSDETSPTGGAQ